MQRLTKRRDYLEVARGDRTSRRGFLLQSRVRDDAEALPRFGFTVTKKIGNAVVRNRIRRRLKEAVRLAGADAAALGRDYVLVGRQPALTLDFAELLRDVVGAVKAAGKPTGNHTRNTGRQTSPGAKDAKEKRAIDG